MKLLARVRQYIEEWGLLREGERLVLGVSGGPDSLCLLDLLHALAGDLRLSLHVAHLNHGLRPEAAAEAELVRAEAAARGLAFHTETVNTRARAHQHKQSIEAAARELRYAFLIRTALSAGAPVIAVAHTADDQAETVLMHFLRGSGAAGLRGMLPKTEVGSWMVDMGVSDLRLPASDLYLVRPLLTTPRAEVDAYCAERHLRPVQDATNRDTTYYRNRLRHDLLPELEKYNPNIRAVLGRTAEVAAGDYEILQRALRPLWEAAAQFEPGRVRFDRPRWLSLTAPEQRALLREAVRHLRRDLRDIDFTPLERAVRFSRTATSGRSCDVLAGLRLSLSSSHITVSAWGTEPASGHVPLVAEDGRLSEGWRFCIESLRPGAWSRDEVENNSRGWQVYVDAARIRAPLRLRARRPGDRFHPLGLHGHSLKVSDYMINVKIEGPLRARWPLVVCGEDIVWLAGLRLDERFKVTPATTEVQRLWFAKDNDIPL